jgi:hypothetical protein
MSDRSSSVGHQKMNQLKLGWSEVDELNPLLYGPSVRVQNYGPYADDLLIGNLARNWVHQIWCRLCDHCLAFLSLTMALGNVSFAMHCQDRTVSRDIPADAQIQESATLVAGPLRTAAALFTVR